VNRKILIMGLPGAGKTTLANALAPLLNAVVFNADAVRANPLARGCPVAFDLRQSGPRRPGFIDPPFRHAPQIRRQSEDRSMHVPRGSSFVKKQSPAPPGKRC
jgi:hypothetical protein